MLKWKRLVDKELIQRLVVWSVIEITTLYLPACLPTSETIPVFEKMPRNGLIRFLLGCCGWLIYCALPMAGVVSILIHHWCNQKTLASVPLMLKPQPTQPLHPDWDTLFYWYSRSQIVFFHCQLAVANWAQSVPSHCRTWSHFCWVRNGQVAISRLWGPVCWNWPFRRVSLPPPQHLLDQSDRMCAALSPDQKASPNQGVLTVHREIYYILT